MLIITFNTFLVVLFSLFFFFAIFGLLSYSAFIISFFTCLVNENIRIKKGAFRSKAPFEIYLNHELNVSRILNLTLYFGVSLSVIILY